MKKFKGRGRMNLYARMVLLDMRDSAFFIEYGFFDKEEGDLSVGVKIWHNRLWRYQ